MRWGSWLSRRSTRPMRLTALHVGEVEELREAHPGLGSPRVRAREATLASLGAVGVQDEFDDVGVVDNDSAVDALLTSASGHGTRGLILGRNQPKDSWSLVSLGEVARKTLRASDEPVFVVPPDYEPPANPGPIAVGVSPCDDASAALKVAEALGQALRLPFEAVHVVPNVARFATAGAPVMYAGAGDMQGTVQEDSRAAVERWMQENGSVCPLHIEIGDAAETLEVTAKRLGATMLVTGSRQLSIIERIFHRSVGSSLAAMSHVPTLVVPPAANSVDEPSGTGGA